MNLFVCGLRRSGTTILYDALARGPRAALLLRAAARGHRDDRRRQRRPRRRRSRPRRASCASAFRAERYPELPIELFNWGGPRAPEVELEPGLPEHVRGLLAHLLELGARRRDQGDPPAPQARRGRRARPRGGRRPPGPRPARRRPRRCCSAAGGAPTSTRTPRPSSPPAPGGGCGRAGGSPRTWSRAGARLDLPADIPDFLRPLLVWKAAFETTDGRRRRGCSATATRSCGSRTCAPTPRGELERIYALIGRELPPDRSPPGRPPTSAATREVHLRRRPALGAARRG